MVPQTTSRRISASGWAMRRTSRGSSMVAKCSSRTPRRDFSETWLSDDIMGRLRIENRPMESAKRQGVTRCYMSSWPWGLLGLACIVLIFRVALLIRVGMVGITTGVVDAAEATAAEAGIAAAVGWASVTEARTTTVEAAESAAVKATEPTPVETAAMETTEAATECRRVFHAGGDARDDRRGRHQCAGPPLAADETLYHRCPPNGYLLAATVWNGTLTVPCGNSGVNTGSAIRGAKSQSVKTAENCGCPGHVL